MPSLFDFSGILGHFVGAMPNLSSIPTELAEDKVVADVKSAGTTSAESIEGTADTGLLNNNRLSPFSAGDSDFDASDKFPLTGERVLTSTSAKVRAASRGSPQSNLQAPAIHHSSASLGSTPSLAPADALEPDFSKLIGKRIETATDTLHGLAQYGDSSVSESARAECQPRGETLSMTTPPKACRVRTGAIPSSQRPR